VREELSRKTQERIKFKTAETKEMAEVVAASVLRLRMRSPFFATLALFARRHASFDLPQGATDGRYIIYNPSFLAGLPQRQLDAVLLHYVLHAALLHPLRRRARDPAIWNIAADIVVNGIIARQDFTELPPGAVRYESLEEKPIEEIYELLQERERLPAAGRCFFAERGGAVGDLMRVECEAYWRMALRQAEIIQRSFGQGKMPAALERLFQYISAPQIDWRDALWRFLAKTPTDFKEFDRRHIGRGLYLDLAEAEGVKVYLVVDTSFSIRDDQFSLFLSEALAILRTYPHLEARLYYAGEELHGPYPLKPGEIVARPAHDGGTSFVPFFEMVEEECTSDANVVCVYLTDGFGLFPQRAPSWPTLWVVTPGGREERGFPFGEVVRLLRER
jgi:predicted metal-dependent peptidase